MNAVQRMASLLFLGALFSSIFGCGSDKPKLVLGTSCTLNSDCTSPLVCKFSKCHRACNEARDCDPGRRCVKVDGVGVCQLIEEQACVAGVCPAPLVCGADNRCANSCPLGTECTPGLVCQASPASPVKICALTTDTIVTGLPDPYNPVPGANDAGAGSDAGSGNDGGGLGGDAPVNPNLDGPIASGDTPATSDTTPPSNRGPLLFDVTATPNPVLAKGRVFYTITVSNISTRPVDLAKVLFRVPMGLTFSYFYDAEPNNTSCTNCVGGSEAVWNLGTIAPGASTTMTINAEVAATLLEGAVLTAPVRLTATGINPIDLMKEVRVVGAATASVALGTAKDAVLAGEAFDVDINVGNVGGAALAGKTLHARLPAGLTAAAISDGGTAASPSEIVWNLDNLPVGDSLRRQIKVAVAAGTPAGEVLSVRAELTATGAAAVEASAEASISVAAAPSPLRIEVTTQPSPAAAKGRILYNINVSNLSPRALDEVEVFMRVPNGQHFSYFYDVEPNATACTNCVAGSEAEWKLGTLAVGASQTISVNALVNDDALDGTLMTAAFKASAKGVEVQDFIRTTQVHNTPSVELALGASKDAVTPGDTFAYVVDVGHIGAAALAGTVLRLRLPPGVTVGTISDGGTAASPQEVVWTIGDVAVGTPLHREVNLTVAPTAPAGEILAARAELTFTGGTQLDASAEHAVTVVGTAFPLKLTVTAAPTPAVANMRLLYAFTINNVSARAIDGIKLQFRTPEGVTFNYFYDSDPDNTGCNACKGGDEAIWTIPTLAVGGTYTAMVNAQVAPMLTTGTLLTGNLTLTATGLPDTLYVPTTLPATR